MRTKLAGRSFSLLVAFALASVFFPRFPTCSRSNASRCDECCLPQLEKRRLSQCLDFGAQSHGLSARCLRFAAFLPGFPVVQPRKTRLPVGDHPCWAGLSPARVPCEVSTLSTSFPPHPSFAWRTAILIPEKSAVLVTAIARDGASVRSAYWSGGPSPVFSTSPNESRLR